MAENKYITPSNNSYKKYVGLLTQTGITSPTIEILENTLGDVTWNYSEPGKYYAVIRDGIDKNKTVVFLQQTRSTDAIFSFGYQDLPDSVFIYTRYFDGSFKYSDSLLSSTPIEIRIYN